MTQTQMEAAIVELQQQVQELKERLNEKESVCHGCIAASITDEPCCYHGLGP